MTMQREATPPATTDPAGTRPLSPRARWLMVLAAFAGWMFAGAEISLFVLISRPALLDLMRGTDEAVIIRWIAWYQCAFLLGAAAGGWLFGWMGDRYGRTRALGLSILCYSLLTGACYFASDPYTLLFLRFLACLGVGGVWPSAVSLSVEALPHVSKPLLAGLMGAAANVGFVLLGLLCFVVPVTPDDWRWVLIVCSLPALLGAAALAWLPESPTWLAAERAKTADAPVQPIREIMRPPLLKRTLIGIALGAIPVVGTAANANWLIPWSDQAATARAQQQVDGERPAGDSESQSSARSAPRVGDPRVKAWTQVTRSGGAIFGSLLGGWIASLLGRRVTYFLISLASFLTSLYIYQFLDPLTNQALFSWFAFLLGFVGVTYFGWLPLYLPELFPTRVRASGTGVTFNSGRVLAAICVLGTGVIMQALGGGSYSQVGTWTGLVYVLGMVIICFAPDTTRQPLEK